MNPANYASIGQALFEEAGDATFLLDPAKNLLLDANPVAERLTGFRRNELQGMAFAHLIDYPQPEQWQALQDAVRRTTAFHARDGYRLRTARPDEWVPVTLSISRLHVKPQPLALVVARDSRKQREAFERLQQVEEQLQRVLASVSDAVWSITRDADERWSLVYCSPALARIAGRPVEYFAERLEQWLQVIHPSDGPRARQEYGRIVGSPPPAVGDVEYRVVWPDGTVRWVRDRVRHSRDAHSGLPRLDGVLSDVTERKQTEERLHTQAQVLAQLSDAVVAVDQDRRVTYWNRAAEQLYGVPALKALGRPLADSYRVAFHRPEDVPAAMAAIKEAGEWAGELLHVRTDAAVIAVECRVSVLRDEAGQSIGMLAVNRDVTARHRALAAIRASEARNRALIHAIPDLLFLQDRRGVYLDCHAHKAEFLFRPREELLGRPMEDVLPPEVLAVLGPALHRVVATGEPQECEYPATVGGERRRFEARLVAVSEVAGRAAGVLSLVRDITERHRAEAALARSEERFRALFERHGSVMLLIDPAADRIIDANRAAEQFYGSSREELQRLSATALNPFAPEPIRQALARASQGRQHHFVMEHRLATGDVRQVEVYASPIDHPDRRLLFAVIHDVTERRQLEDRLRQVQKLEAIGRLAGGIAHDFNNLMTAVTGYGSLLAARLGPDTPEREYADEINKAGGRAAELTKQLLTFGRKSVSRPTVLDLNQVVRGMMRMLGRLVGDGGRLTAQLVEGLWAVKVDQGQTEQVLLNLVTNARDSLRPEGGAITVATENVVMTDDMVPARPEVQPGRYVRLTVSDTGCGMDRETLGRVFEPFFTTKPVGRGTGLGLAMVYGVVQQAGGYVFADSALGQGTTVTVFLPRVEEPLARAEAPVAPEAMPGGRETVLLVEDEDGVRALVDEILTKCGYAVVAAGDGPRGLEAAAAHGGPIDLIVSDVVMPGLAGPQMVAELRRRRPEVRVLYISGHLDPRNGDGPPGTDGARVLHKPFTPVALAKAVREVLDTEPRG